MLVAKAEIGRGGEILLYFVSISVVDSSSPMSLLSLSSVNSVIPQVDGLDDRKKKHKGGFKKAEKKDKKNIVCFVEGCEESFSHPTSLDRHVKKEHPGAVNPDMLAKRRSCHMEGCRLGFTSKKNLDN